jgi:hypothetical protein
MLAFCDGSLGRNGLKTAVRGGRHEGPVWTVRFGVI